MISRLWDVVRGTVAWTVGYLLTIGLVTLDVVGSGSGILGEAASVFVAAHVVPPAAAGVDPIAVAAVPVVAVGVVGYRAGTRRETGVVGRLRSVIGSFRGGNVARVRSALRSGVSIAGGYALVTTVVAVVLEMAVVTVAVSAFLTALIVAVPATYLGLVR